MGWNTKLLGGEILKGKSGKEVCDEEKHNEKHNKEDEGEERYQTRCQIKGKHRRGLDWCEDVYNCKDCWYFKKYMPNVKWVCWRCLEQLESMVDFEILSLEYYHSGFCELCKEETAILMPIKIR